MVVTGFFAAPVTAAGLPSTQTSQVATVEDEFGVVLEAETESPEEAAVVTLGARGDDLAGYEANVSFDPSVLQFDNATGADFPDPVTNFDNDDGWVYLTSSHQDGHEHPTVAVLEFDVVGTGGDETDIQFIEADTLVNTADLDVYEASSEEITTESASLEVVGTETAISESVLDLSPLTIVGAAFGAGVLLMAVIVGAVLYGKRLGQQ
ncbi:cohesin domain-containing protein [Natronobacterium gregoryi]|uniref:cohesin domain-containing protein n=1 Tax=Natronobacterium gregoryi TaxID=44930 RepID=UPI0012DEE0F6|nr:cohesin domain-containing protein [Natronobacterium gregoryi]